jgi:hypothetical protein
MPLEAALFVLAVSVLGMWVLSIAIDDRRFERRRGAPHGPAGPAVNRLDTCRVNYVETLDERCGASRRARR